MPRRASLLDPRQGRIPLLFRKSDQPNQQPGWIRLDCSAADRQVAVDETVRLGGRVIAHRSDSNGKWALASLCPYCAGRDLIPA